MPNKFREELRRIASRDREPLLTASIRRPESYGWLRRPELDQSGLAAWECPNGELRGIAVGADFEPTRRRASR